MSTLQKELSPAGLGSLLGRGLASLDLTPVEHERVVSRYEALGAVLDEHWTATRGNDAMAPQGSFLLGTVVRNIHRNDDVDIDAVACRDLDKHSTTQADLKTDVGHAAAKYARRSSSGRPRLLEWERCWTLVWPGMHLDVLPALPDPSSYSGGLLITDRNVRNWLKSNPSGYASWFRSRMRDELRAERELVAKAERLEIEEVPEYLVKTALQQTVQALKRHRDIYFTNRLDQRPSSIVITTLAALAYEGGEDLYDILRRTTSAMGQHLRRENGVWLLPNPSQPEENFVDSWVTQPAAPARLFEWIEAASRDFDDLGARAGIHNQLPLLSGAFGTKVAEHAATSLGTSLTGARARGDLSVTAGAALSIAGVRPGSGDQRVRQHGFAGGRPN